MPRPVFSVVCSECLIDSVQPANRRLLGGIYNGSTDHDVYLHDIKLENDSAMGAGSASITFGGSGTAGTNCPPGTWVLRKITACSGGTTLTKIQHDSTSSATSTTVVAYPDSVTTTADIAVAAREVLPVGRGDTSNGSALWGFGSGPTWPGATGLKGGAASLWTSAGYTVNALQAYRLAQNTGISLGFEDGTLTAGWIITVTIREDVAGNVTSTFVGLVRAGGTPGRPSVAIFNSDADDVEVLSISLEALCSASASLGQYTSDAMRLMLFPGTMTSWTTVTPLCMDTTTTLPTGITGFKNGVGLMRVGSRNRADIEETMMLDSFSMSACYDTVRDYDYRGQRLSTLPFIYGPIAKSSAAIESWGDRRGSDGIRVPPGYAIGIFAHGTTGSSNQLGSMLVQSSFPVFAWLYNFEFLFSVVGVGTGDVAYIG